MNLLQEASGMGEWITRIRREIHRHPEVGFSEEGTAALVEETLHSLGLASQRLCGTGVVCLIEGEREGGCVALRADMDALPMQDEKRGELHSLLPGIAHSCGHDAHTACLLGAARLLAGRRDFAGSVKLIFQPAEETDSGGALPMIAQGVLDTPYVDEIFGLHVDPDCDAGCIKVSAGKMHASSDMFDVVLSGDGCHGAYPHKAQDVLLAACQSISLLQTVVARNTPPLESAVLTVGMLQAGTARNIIPAKAEFSGIIRTLDPQVRDMAVSRLRTIINGVAAAMEVEVSFRCRRGFPVLCNDESSASLVRAEAVMMLGGENVLVAVPSLGVEDFAYFLQRRPGCFFNLGVRNEERGIVHPLHSSLFDIDEAALPVGASLLAGSALAALTRRNPS